MERGVRLGKAVVQAAVEHEREAQEQLLDRIKAAENVAANAYTDTFGASGSGEEKQKGDEALPPVKEGDGRPPKVIYSHGEWFLIIRWDREYEIFCSDMVYDMAGYHSKDKSKPEQEWSRECLDRSDSDERDESCAADF